jgi:penicillin-binding protein 1A
MASLHMITQQQAADAKRQPLGVRQNTYYSAKRENYFFDYVKEQLIERYGITTVRKGGLKVYTTVNLGLQREARNAMQGVLNESGDPSSAIVTIDPRNGYIRAMASTGSYGANKFNYAAQGHRQPGSTAKIWVLMTALRKGIDPQSTSYNSHPLDLNTAYGPWKVQTYSGSYGGNMNLVQATLRSDNTVFAQLDLDVGPDAVRQTAYDMGVTTKLDGYPAEGLGGLSLGVSPLEMANAYATIASGGYRNKPIAIRKVVFHDGKSEDLGKPRRKKMFSDGVTYEATKILEQNMQSGTATRAAISCPAAAKTGTTDDFTDAWLDGFTPHLSTSVWVGYPNSKVPMLNVHGIQVNGGSLPSQIWHDYMAVAVGNDCPNFPQPTESFSSQPFFGSYAATGGRDNGGSYGNGNGNGNGNGTANGIGNGGGTRGNGGEAGGGAGDYNNRNLYESPPQHAPRVSPPPKGTGGTGQ